MALDITKLSSEIEKHWSAQRLLSSKDDDNLFVCTDVNFEGYEQYSFPQIVPTNVYEDDDFHSSQDSLSIFIPTNEDTDLIIKLKELRWSGELIKDGSYGFYVNCGNSIAMIYYILEDLRENLYHLPNDIDASYDTWAERGGKTINLDSITYQIKSTSKKKENILPSSFPVPDAECILFAKSKLISTSRNYLAYRFLKELIEKGLSDEQIMKAIRSKHKEDPAIYSFSGGIITRPTYNKFKKGVYLINKKRNQGGTMRTNVRDKYAKEAKEWKEKSVGYNWAIDKLKQGWDYKEIIDEFNRRHNVNPTDYSSRKGKPLTVAILSGWARKNGLGYGPGGKTRQEIDNWKKNNIGYNWVKEQILLDKDMKNIIEEFNNMHKTNPSDYSSFMGGEMTQNTYMRWRKEILASINSDDNMHATCSEG